jgi:hypothetical protein
MADKAHFFFVLAAAADTRSVRRMSCFIDASNVRVGTRSMGAFCRFGCFSRFVTLRCS